MRQTASKIIRQIVLKNLLVIIISILISTILILFLVSKIKSQFQNLIEKQTLLFLAQNRTQSSNKLELDFKKIEENLPNIKKALPDQNNLLEYLSDLDATSKSFGLISTVSIQQNASQAPLLDGKVVPVEFTMQVQGNLHSFNQFLEAVERLPYYTKILSLDSTSEKNVSDSANFNLKAQVLTHSPKLGSNSTNVLEQENNQ